MAKSRRQFLKVTSLGMLGAATVLHSEAQAPSELPPGAPPAWGTAPPVGPPVSTTTFSEAEKLVQFSMGPGDREMAAQSWREMMAGLYERRTGPHKLELEATLAPAIRWDPRIPGVSSGPQVDRFVRSNGTPGPTVCPTSTCFSPTYPSIGEEIRVFVRF